MGYGAWDEYNLNGEEGRGWKGSSDLRVVSLQGSRRRFRVDYGGPRVLGQGLGILISGQLGVTVTVRTTKPKKCLLRVVARDYNP